MLSNEEHKCMGSEAGLKVKKPKAQLVIVSNRTSTPALLWLKAADGWPVVLVALLPTPSPCVTTGKVVSQQLRNIHRRAKNQMLSDNMPVPCSQESPSEIPAVTFRGRSLMGNST